MKTPPYLLGLGLLFWGWQTGNLLIGLIAGVILEASHVTTWRWDFTFKEYRRIWDLCFLILVIVGLLLYLSEEITRTAYVFFRWWPMVFFLMVMAQVYGPEERLPLSTFSWFARRRQKSGEEERYLNITWLYFTLCIVAAGSTMNQPQTFYPLFCVLAGWALWLHRPRRLSAPVWIVIFALVAGAGYVGHRGMSTAQNLIEGKISEWLSNLVRRDLDANESRTSIGQIGKLKLSGEIVLRVSGENTVPDLLREATYFSYKEGNWFSGVREYQSVTVESNGASWVLSPAPVVTETVTISKYLRRGRGILPLPLHTKRLDALPVEVVETNSIGVVRVNEGPGIVEYQARYAPEGWREAAPENDLTIPFAELPAIAAITEELQLANLPIAEVRQRLSAFFTDQFTYTTFLENDGKGTEDETPLARFLLRQRKGHCEYFATATALILRHVGIPARYAVGYSVQESVGVNRFVVRERHAHAWSVLYNRETGTWENFDTTPSGWAEMEAQTSSFWEPLRDAFSRLGFEFSRWRWLSDNSEWRNYLIGALVFLTLVLAYRIFVRQRRRAAVGAGEGNDAGKRLGLDSEFFTVEKRLNELGWTRRSGESLSGWSQRLQGEAALPLNLSAWRSLVELHTRYRFDPDQLPVAERTRLRALAEEVLQRLKPVRNEGARP